MSLITNSSTGTKKAYTRAEDEKIVALRNEGKSIAEIAEATGRSPASIQYRIGRKLSTVDSFDEIKYKGASKVADVACEEEVSEEN